MTDTRCQGNTTTCDGLELAPVKLGLRNDVFVLCAGCRRTASAMGAQIVERRVAQVPVAVERRAWVPRWRRGDLARDLTGSVLA